MRPATALQLTCDYGFYGQLSYLLPRFEVFTAASDFGERVSLELMVEPQFCDNAIRHITDISSGAVVPEITGEKLLEKKL